ncbi:MAG TPA: hypothetical protein VGH19_21965 [Verrucomicrobiae bacterium]
MKSPNGKYEVVPSGYNEVRMGTPLYGSVKVLGTSMDTAGEFGEVMAFSADSRFLAVEELVDSSQGPNTHAVVFDLERKRKIIVHVQNPGIIKRLAWSAEGLLTIVTWSNMGGEREYQWQAPKPEAPGWFQTILE